MVVKFNVGQILIWAYNKKGANFDLIALKDKWYRPQPTFVAFIWTVEEEQKQQRIKLLKILDKPGLEKTSFLKFFFGGNKIGPLDLA